MKIQTKELIGDPLDWAVHRAYCEGACDDEPLTDDERYSTDWAQGGPIIEREKIGSLHEARGVWSASTKWEEPIVMNANTPSPMMVPRSLQDAQGPVQLFAEEHPHQLMREDHGRER